MCSSDLKIAQSLEQMHAGNLEEIYYLLAYQYKQSENHPKAYEYFRMSGIKASINFANEESCKFYQEALESLNRMPETEENKKRVIEISKLMHGPIFCLCYPEYSLEIFQKAERLSREIGDKKSLAAFIAHISGYYATSGMPLEGIKYVEPRFY